MSVINTIIQPQSFEKVLARIGEILADELHNQSVMAVDSDIEAKVFIERLVPFDNTELPAINVCLAQGLMDGQTAIQSDGTYTFFIDVHTKSKSSAGQKGDAKVVLKLHRLIGLVRAILEDTRYITLGFVPPSIMRRYVQQIGISMPQVKDLVSVVMGRVTFSVKVAETVDLTNAGILAGYETVVKLELTEKGYQYIINT